MGVDDRVVERSDWTAVRARKALESASRRVEAEDGSVSQVATVEASLSIEGLPRVKPPVEATTSKREPSGATR